MKVLSFRATTLAIALTLGAGMLAEAHACNGTASQTPHSASQDKYDQVSVQSDLLALAELLVFGLALLEAPSPAARPCSGCAPTH